MVLCSFIQQGGDAPLANCRRFLETEGIDLEDFDEKVLACLPKVPWTIAADEVSKRRDLRSLRSLTATFRRVVIFY